MNTSRYISMCTDRDTVFEACQYLPGDGGRVCYLRGMRDISMDVTLVILNPVILPGFDPMWVLYADIVPPAKACTAFEFICVRVSEYIMSDCVRVQFGRFQGVRIQCVRVQFVRG